MVVLLGRLRWGSRCRIPRGVMRMGFGRDLGAALTMGLTLNTEHKQAEDEHKKRAALHERTVGAFNAIYHQTGEKSKL